MIPVSVTNPSGRAPARQKPLPSSGPFERLAQQKAEGKVPVPEHHHEKGGIQYANGSSAQHHSSLQQSDHSGPVDDPVVAHHLSYTYPGIGTHRTWWGGIVSCLAAFFV
jgi:hypothetical protein